MPVNEITTLRYVENCPRKEMGKGMPRRVDLGDCRACPNHRGEATNYSTQGFGDEGNSINCDYGEDQP